MSNANKILNIDKTILVVEDEEPLRTSLAKKLGDSGYQVITAENGKRALEVVKSHPPDLILLDLFMPEMDGFDFFYYLKQEIKQNIPIIVMTNLSTSPYPIDVRDFFIKSDTTLEEVVAKVHRVIGQKS